MINFRRNICRPGIKESDRTAVVCDLTEMAGVSPVPVHAVRVFMMGGES
jgi:hypothetical protein